MTFEPIQPKVGFVPAEEFLINDLETLKVMADPLRLRLREMMFFPTTVKHLSSELDILATKLYYHINLLEKHGLIVVVDAKVVSGIIEKHYQVSAKRVRVAPHLLSAPDENAAGLTLSINSLMDDTKADLFESIQKGVVNLSSNSAVHEGGRLLSLRLRLSEDEAKALFERFNQLVDEFIGYSNSNRNQDLPDTQMYKMLGVLFPTSRADKQSDSSED
jgi:DNA-binding PadR family transcriptional regulator